MWYDHIPYLDRIIMLGFLAYFVYSSEKIKGDLKKVKEELNQLKAKENNL